MRTKKNSRNSKVLKLVHPRGLVEIHKKPITAAEVMKKNPRHYVTRPDVFRNPWIVVCPEAVLTPGNVFFVVPCHTLRRLMQKHKKPQDQAHVASFPFQEKDVLSSRDKKTCCELELLNDQDLKVRIKGRSSFEKEGYWFGSSEPKPQDEKKDSHHDFVANHELKGHKRGWFGFGEGRSSHQSPPVEMNPFHQLLQQQHSSSYNVSRGRDKVDCKFEEEEELEGSIFPKYLVGGRTKEKFDPLIHKPSIAKSSQNHSSDSPRNPVKYLLKRFDEMNILGHSRKHASGFESDKSPRDLYNQRSPLYSLSIAPDETEVLGPFSRDYGGLELSNDREDCTRRLKSCLKKENPCKASGVRVKFWLPGEDENKIRVQVFEF